MADLKIIEKGDGADVIFTGNDFAAINGWQNMVYLDLFGGNILQSTGENQQEGEQRFDFWGNKVLNPENTDVWFNSLLERRLKSLALTTQNLSIIEDIVLQDLDFMNEFADISVSASIPTVDTFKISINIIEPSSQNQNQFTYIWDGTNIELKEEKFKEKEGFGVLFPYVLNYEL